MYKKSFRKITFANSIKAYLYFKAGANFIFFLNPMALPFTLQLSLFTNKH